MWFAVIDQPIFAIAGFLQRTKNRNGFAMVICDPNGLVAPIHPKAMITVLHPDDWDRWLSGSFEEVVALQRSYSVNAAAVSAIVGGKRQGVTTRNAELRLPIDVICELIGK